MAGSMTDRTRQKVWLLGTALALAACGGEPEVATEHIRQTLGGAAPAAMDAPATVAPEDGAAAAEGVAAGEQLESAGAVDPAFVPVVALPSGDTMHVRAAVVEFYDARGYEPAWTDHRELTPDGVRALAALSSVAYDGLDPNRYGFGVAQEMAVALRERETGERTLEYLGNLDILLTESVVRATMELEEGLIDPEAAGLEWRFERTESNDSAVVARLAEGDDPRSILASVRPRAPYYSRLAGGLERLRAVEAAGGWPTVAEGGTLRPGDRDTRIAAVRDRLLAGEDEHERRLAEAGRQDPQRFDEDLEAAVRHFQTRHTLLEDGAFGPATLAAMNVPVEDRIETVRLNLDRWRRLPQALGEEYLLVNVAGFELELVAGDTVIESMSVVVGRTANRTPLFRDSLQYVVVNPYWNVPISIAREEIIPGFRRDPGYLARNDYEVLLNDRRVDPYWLSPTELESGRYLIRQRPGPRNALGNVKFLFPNAMNIYLHDTPAGHLFGQESRAFSYGCIRVERPDDLARTLLERYSSRDGAEYDRLRSRSGEQWVTLEQQIPIYILYFTAWARPDGSIRFHPDIYERDAALAGEVESKLPALAATRSTAPRPRSG
jgi:L,D-transpeptidase YcbB